MTELHGGIEAMLYLPPAGPRHLWGGTEGQRGKWGVSAAPLSLCPASHLTLIAVFHVTAPALPGISECDQDMIDLRASQSPSASDRRSVVASDRVAQSIPHPFALPAPWLPLCSQKKAPEVTMDAFLNAHRHIIHQIHIYNHSLN